MKTLEKKLFEKFDKKYLNIFLEKEEFNILQTKEDLLSSMNDAQFYVFDGTEIDPVIFQKYLDQNLAHSIAKICCDSRLSLLYPEQLICISDTCSNEKANSNGTFNAHIYDLTLNQIKQINNEYYILIANKYN